MKVSRGKSRSGGEFQILGDFEDIEGSISFDNASLDEELWEDWRKVVEVDHRRVPSPKKRMSASKRKSLHTPITVNSALPVPIPRVLRRPSKKEPKNAKCPQRRNKILRDFINLDSSEPIVAKVTICRTIVPDEIRQERRSKKIKLSPQMQASASVTDDSFNKFEGDVSMNVDETICDDSICPANDKVDVTLDTSQIPEEVSLPHFYSLREKVICVIEPQSGFSFQGKLRVQVLYGAIKIYGALLTKENTEKPVEVYSPRGTSLVSLTSVPGPSTAISDVWRSLSSDAVDRTICNDLQSQVNHLEAGWAVLRLQNVENNLTDFLGRFCSHRLFPRIEDASNYSWSDPKRAEIVLQVNLQSGNSGKKSMEFCRSEGLLEEISQKKSVVENKKLRILFAGGKSVGKSTTARYFVNGLLEKHESVVFVDLDIGQAEFTPPGCVSLTVVRHSLLGPNFTHLETPFYQEFVGGVDPTKHLGAYVEGVKRLAEFLDGWKEVSGLPVVVNTMGFCRGIGWDIMGQVIRSFRPTDVVQIISKRPKNNFDQLLSCEIMSKQIQTWKNWSTSSEAASLSYDLHTMETEAEIRTSADSWNIEPHQQREIVMLAYLSGILRAKRSKKGCDLVRSVSEVVPFQVPFSAVKVSLGKPLVPDVLSVMNGSIVALCGVDVKDVGRESAEAGGKVGYPQVLMKAPSAICHGFGILRGVDMTDEKLYINTPVSISDLKHVNCLIGSMPVPSGLLQLDSGLPYAGDNCDLPTSRDSRRGYFRMRP